jgi:hypothetical protein
MRACARPTSCPALRVAQAAPCPARHQRLAHCTPWLPLALHSPVSGSSSGSTANFLKNSMASSL